MGAVGHKDGHENWQRTEQVLINGSGTRRVAKKMQEVMTAAARVMVLDGRQQVKMTLTSPAAGLVCWQPAGCGAKRAATCAARPSW